MMDGGVDLRLKEVAALDLMVMTRATLLFLFLVGCEARSYVEQHPNQHCVFYNFGMANHTCARWENDREAGAR